MAVTILAIESSCDETSAAVCSDGKILSNIIAGQKVHAQYGGVVPELASRAHMQNIVPVVDAAIRDAGCGIKDVDAVAFTRSPGLIGSLLVGAQFAKSLALSLNKPLIAVHHMQAHVLANLIEDPKPAFPFLCLTVSGGHTQIVLCESPTKMKVIGETIDDAAGEAFDKIAKLMGLGYPGGPVIEKLATAGNFQDYFHYPRASAHGFDFSFSGLKTAVLYDLVKRNAYDMKSKKFLKADDLEFQQQVASSLLVCMKDIFVAKFEQVIKQYTQLKAVTFVGGVACNKYLKTNLAEWCKNKGLEFYTPSPQYCTDNGAMIAFVGSYKAAQGKYSTLELDILR